MDSPQFVYILICADGTFYTGSTSDLALRLTEHQSGSDPSAYTFRRRPVRLVWCEGFPTFDQALAREHQIKGWSHEKKKALIEGGVQAVRHVAGSVRGRRNKTRIPNPA